MDMEHEIKKAEPRLVQDKIRSMDAAEFVAPSAQQAAGSIDTGELRRLAEAATPGYWTYWPTTEDRDAEIAAPCGVRVANLLQGDVTKDNSAFIAAANPSAILRLLDALAAATPAQPIADVSAPTDERAAFEASRKPRTDLARKSDRYTNPVVQNCWETWQAARAAAPVSGASDGPEFIVDDADLDALLNLAADMAKGIGNMDSGILFLEILAKVESRLLPAAPVSGQGVSIGDDDEFHKLFMAARNSYGPRVQDPYRALVRYIDSRPRSEDSRAKVLEEALEAYVSFAKTRREELGALSPEMELVDTKARAALASTTPQKADNE